MASAAAAAAEAQSSALLLDLAQGADHTDVDLGHDPSQRIISLRSGGWQQMSVKAKTARASLLILGLVAAALCAAAMGGLRLSRDPAPRASAAGRSELRAFEAQPMQAAEDSHKAPLPAAAMGPDYLAKKITSPKDLAKVLNGDTIYIKAHTGKFLDVTGTEVRARFHEHHDWQALTILLPQSASAPIRNGDLVYLQSQHTGKYINVEETEIQAKHAMRSNGQEFLISAEHNGTIRSGDTVYLQSAATGMMIDVVGEGVLARFNQKSGFEELKMLKKDALKKCAGANDNCLAAKCCKDPGHTCFDKDQWWSQCRPECHPGPDPLDPAGPSPWSCKAHGPKAPGRVEEKQCSGPGEDCRETQCCSGAGMTCFEKDSDYAACHAECTPGPNLKDKTPDPWTCRALGNKTKPVADWVSKTCAQPGQDCRTQQCCAQGGTQCFMKDTTYAECKPSCKKGEITGGPEDTPWSCDMIGSRTPFYEKIEDNHRGQVSPWVEKHCSDEGENCGETQCCRGVNMQCFAKNDDWASCKPECSTAPDPNDNNATWDCKALGPRSWGLSTVGYPSLFCFSVLRVEGYEPGLMRSQANMTAGIFGCDGYLTLADGVISLGTPKGRDVEVITKEIPKITVGVSQDGTAANAKLFMAAWDKILADGSYRNYDWTVKVDPDAVLLSWRLRDHMRPHTGQKIYVVNCNKFPGSPNFPMMYGALEIFSLPAMAAYAAGSWKCGQQLPWGAWGEDYYMTHCMDFLGVGRIGDFSVLGDNTCTGAHCASPWTAAFHPFKGIPQWTGCWGQATAAGV